MTQYFFHLRDGTDIAIDSEGRQLDGPRAVARAAMAEARALISQDALDGRISLAQRIDVEDSSHRIVYSLEFADAVEVVPPHALLSPSGSRG